MLSHFIICSYFAVFIAPDFFHIFFRLHIVYTIGCSKKNIFCKRFSWDSLYVNKTRKFTGIAMVLILILCGTSKKIYFRLDKTMKPLVPCLRKLLHLSHMVKLISNMIHNPSLEKGLVWFHTDRWGVFWNFKKFLTHW